VHRGPLDFDIVRYPERLAALATEHDAGTIVLDSLKDVASALSEDDGGSGVNRAAQMVVAAGVELLILHHQRKRQQGGGKPRTLDDVYGSGWITSGAGSVLLLWGDAGDAIIAVDHLKPPMLPVGPLKVVLDHDAGTLSVVERPDPLALLRSVDTLTAADAARMLYASTERNDVERARRQLERLVKAGLATRDDAKPPHPVRYTASHAATHAAKTSRALTPKHESSESRQTIQSRETHANHAAGTHVSPSPFRGGVREPFDEKSAGQEAGFLARAEQLVADDAAEWVEPEEER
jgi:replicative DNA helicase